MKHKCFECGCPAKFAHHVVPVSKNGTRTIPLCLGCHEKVHQYGGMALGSLIKLGLQRAKANGVKLGRKGTLHLKAPDILALRSQGFGIRAIARTLGIPASSAHKIIRQSESEAINSNQ